MTVAARRQMLAARRHASLSDTGSIGDAISLKRVCDDGRLERTMVSPIRRMVETPFASGPVAVLCVGGGAESVRQLLEY